MRIAPRRFLLLALLAPVMITRCNCDEVVGNLPTPQIDVRDDQGNSHRDATPWLVIDLGDADSGQRKARMLTVENIGTGQLEIESMCLVTAADAGAALGAPCIIGQQVAFSFQSIVGEKMKRGETRSFEVAFHPFIGGPAKLFLQIASSAVDEPRVAIELVGRGTDGRLCADEGVYDFGDVPVGVTQPGQVTLSNCGVKPVTIESFAFANNPDNAFTVTAQGGDPVGRTLQENETIVLDLTFTPQQPGPYRDTRAGDVRVMTAAPFAAQYDLILIGNGIVPPSCRINVVPSLLNFNAVASGTSQTRQVIVQSVGQCGCTVESIAAPEPSDAGFTLGTLPQLPAVLRGTLGCEDDPEGAAAAPNNIVIDVTYTSPVRDVPQTDRASFDVVTTDLAQPQRTVQLEANGGGAPFCQLRVEPQLGAQQQISFNPTTGRWGVVEFGRTSIHTEKKLPITLTSIGNTTCNISQVRYDDPANTAANEFRLENENGSPAIPASAFSLEPGQTRTFFAVFAPTRTISSNSIFPSFGSYSGSIPSGERSDDPFTWGLFCGGTINGPNARCNGVRFVTNDTTTDVSRSDQRPGIFSIGFSGTPVKPDVDVIPPELDFGLVTLDCGSPRRRTTLYNNGGADLVVGQPFVDPNTNPVTFRVEGTTNATNQWPYRIAPGGSMSIEVRYFARTLALETANLIVPTFEGNQDGPPVSIPLRGQGTTETSATDIFDQFRDPKVDVLWVVDDSGSMAPYQDLLAQNFNQFFVASNVRNADFHIAVTTTLWADDQCLGAPPSCQTNADCGMGGQCTFGLCTAGNAANSCSDDDMAGWYTACRPQNGHYISPVATNPEADFTCNVRVADRNNVNPSRPASDSAEGGLRAAMKFLSPPLINDPNSNGGFMRDDAKLHVIIVSDEPEQSKGGVEQYIDFFKNVKGFRNEGLVAVSAIAAPPQGCTAPDGTQLQDSRYKAVVDEMNGRFQEICSQDWTSMMSQLGLDSLGLRVEFFLSRAAEPASIQVCVRQNGANDPNCVSQTRTSEGASNGWFYDAVSNSVVFNPGSVPPRGSRVEVRYGTFCFQM